MVLRCEIEFGIKLVSRLSQSADESQEFPKLYTNCFIIFKLKKSCKVREMQNLSMVFKSNFNYNHRVEHKKLL